MFLAKSTKHVYALIRSAGLADTISRHLVRRIEETPAITLLPHTEIIALEGRDHLERLTWRNNQTGETEEKDIPHVFVMTGRSLTQTGSMVVSRSTINASLRLVQIYRQKTSALGTGLWLVGHACSKPASQESSRPVMCEAVTSNALRLR